ncbi:MAG: hypothetical protein NE330_18540 [Lentisphaeraceae bacterium]|nr:hypothetical protein [Lentisphaeraceae bacterium]
MKLFEKLSFRIVIYSFLLWLVFTGVFLGLLREHGFMRETIIAYGLCLSLYILFLIHHKLKNLRKVLVLISIVYPFILLKVFVWDQRPGEVEGFYKGRDFGCMCHEGIYHFKDGEITKYSLAHENKDELGSYEQIGDKYWFTSTSGEKIEIFPKKSKMVFKSGFDGEPYPKVGYRVTISSEELNKYESFITTDEMIKQYESKQK